MKQTERRVYLIEYLLAERGERIEIPNDAYNQKRLLRSLFNIRMPKETSEDFLQIQDVYLQEENRRKGITDIADLQPVQDDIYLWQGDITTLRCDAINAIHTFAGVQLRRNCNEIMQKQGHNEPTGQAKITPAYNLPCKYVLHTVGPIVSGRLTEEHCELLKSCYLSCLKLAEKNSCKSIAFCCISTGVFGFPQREAAQIAVDTVKRYKEENHSDIKVIFNVFKDDDYAIYNEILRS